VLDNMRAMGALAALLKDRGKLEERARLLKEELADLRAEGQAGGGAVRVVATGDMRVHSVHVEPAVLAGMAADERSASMAQDLIAQATNDALSRAQSAARDTIARHAADMGLPPDLVGSFGAAAGL